MSSPNRVIAMIVTNTARAATVPNMELAPVDASVNRIKIKVPCIHKHSVLWYLKNNRGSLNLSSERSIASSDNETVLFL